MNAAKLHETALHHAAKVKNVDLIELLVEFGGNVYARDNLKRKPINYTSLGSPSYLCLEFYESEFPVFSVHFVPSSFDTPLKANVLFFPIVDTPLTLQQISRVAVRRAVGQKAGEVLSKLGLPIRIIRFLSYMPPQIFDIQSGIAKEGYV